MTPREMLCGACGQRILNCCPRCGVWLELPTAGGGMDTAALYNASKILAAVLAIGSAAIATASNLPDLGLSKQTVAILTVVQTAIAVTLTFLPAIQHSAGDVRGGGGEH